MDLIDSLDMGQVKISGLKIVRIDAVIPLGLVNLEAGELHIQVLNIEGIVFDESFAGFDNVAHENVEHLIGLDGVLFIQTNLEELTSLRIHGGCE